MDTVNPWEKLYERLLKWEKKELDTGEMDDGAGNRCTLGACLPELSGAEVWVLGSVDGGARLGLTLLQVREVYNENDNFEGTPQERYAHMLAWLDERRKQ